MKARDDDLEDIRNELKRLSGEIQQLRTQEMKKVGTRKKKVGRWMNLRHALLAGAMVYLILEIMGAISSPDYTWILAITGWLYFDFRNHLEELKDKFEEHLKSHP